MPEEPPTSTRVGGGGLGRKVGPLPMWGWIVVGLAGVAIFVYTRRKSSGTSTGATTGAPAGTSSAGYGLDPGTTGQLASTQAGLANLLNALPAASSPYSSVAAYGQQHQFAIDSKGELVHYWTNAAGQWWGEILGSNFPASSTTNSTLSGDTLTTNVLDAAGNTIFTTNFAPGNTPYGWSGGQRVIGAIVPPWTTAHSTVVNPTGGSPAPIQPRLSSGPLTPIGSPVAPRAASTWSGAEKKIA